MDLIEKLKTLHISESDLLRVIGHIRFKNSDHIVSIQASEFHYCIPRKLLPLDEYTHFEMLTDFPSEDVPHYLNEYGDGEIFGYVPKEVIERFLDSLHIKYEII